MEFTEDEIREKLRELGYVNVPQAKLYEFMKDLQELILHEETLATTTNTEYLDTSSDEEDLSTSFPQRKPFQDRNERTHPVAFSKEKKKGTSQDVDVKNQPPKTFKHTTASKENISVSEQSDIFSSTFTDSEYNESQSRYQPTANVSSVRRKVSRKKNGKTHVFDETFSDNCSVASDITSLEERLRGNRLDEDDTYSMTSSTRGFLQQENDMRTQLPAFIRPSTAHPHTKKIRKCDPVSRYHQFRSEWKVNRVPGESKHSSLRWSVREQMLNCEVFEKPKHRHSANNYVVPTEKKRQALRWQVRTALAKT